MDKTAELLDRIAALELRVAQLEARPQPAQPIGGAGNWPWLKPGPFGWKVDGTQVVQAYLDTPNVYTVPSKDGTQMRVRVVGDDVSRETLPGPNGAGGPNDGQR